MSGQRDWAEWDAELLRQLRAVRTVADLAAVLKWYVGVRGRAVRTIAKVAGANGLSRSSISVFLAGRRAIPHALLKPLAAGCGFDTEAAFVALGEAWSRISRDDPAPPPGRTPPVEQPAEVESDRDRHLATLETMAEVAGRMNDESTFGFAQAIYERVLDMRRVLLGDRHPDTLTARHNLGAVLGQLDDLDAACVVLDIAYRTRRDTLGPADPATLASMEALAAARANVGERHTARKLLEESLVYRRENLEAVAGTDDERPALLERYRATAANLVAQVEKLDGPETAAELRRTL
ncbi:tetratricopeptide repeat protein [Actinoplanes sp. L3-i22]|uniref:tetratricopeptide repeat protein n=1 Tax=Actinoplanes sp. L3-i22 TaxID=2836373 RepID=UPI001C74C4E4|nr:tetratricopeptide repeat protein [Actinoplanes sp. L3-i22]BCY07674.1 hypothetical protein L3i22_027620 [Actinoplanes sp. L3-i22]